MTVYEDPLGWLRPYFARLSQHPAFATFAPSTRFAQLLDAVAVENPTKAAEMRAWSAGAQHALLQHLASREGQGGPADRIEMWTAEKNTRVLRCVARHLATGVDVMVFERDEFKRSQLCPTAPDVRTPCPKCGAHGVWTRVADVKRERALMVFVFECTLCRHHYREEHAAPPLKVAEVKAPRRTVSKAKRR